MVGGQQTLSTRCGASRCGRDPGAAPYSARGWHSRRPQPCTRCASSNSASDSLLPLLPCVGKHSGSARLLAYEPKPTAVRILTEAPPNQPLKRARREAPPCFAGTVPARRLAASRSASTDNDRLLLERLTTVIMCWYSIQHEGCSLGSSPGSCGDRRFRRGRDLAGSSAGSALNALVQVQLSVRRRTAMRSAL